MPQRHGSGDVRVTGAPSRGGFPFSTVFGLIILGAVGWAAWKFYPQLIAKFHMATPAENAADVFVHGIPPQEPSEDSLAEAARNGSSDALNVHAAHGVKWYVAYGTPGGLEKPRVVRNDDFGDDARKFFDGVIADADAKGKDAAMGMKSAPSPARWCVSWRTVTLPYYSHPWRVVVGWTGE